MKSIIVFVRTEQNESELVTIQIQITMAKEVTADYDFLQSLGFKFNQIEADYLRAEFQTPDYEKGIEVLDKLRVDGYIFE